MSLDETALRRESWREGVPVTHLHYNDQMHGFLTMGKLIRASQAMIETMAVALRRAWS